MWKIANRFGVTVDEIVDLNNLTSTVLQIGDVLLIPGTNGTTTVPPTSDNEAIEDGNITYVVQSGDSLYSIAKKFNTTVNALKTANNFTSNLLSIGQTLVIPTNSSYINYYVKSGDNLYNIARVYNTTVDEIRRLNNLTSDTLSINQLLLIPA